MSQKITITNPEGSLYNINVATGASITPTILQPGQSAKFDLPVNAIQGDHVLVPNDGLS